MFKHVKTAFWVWESSRAHIHKWLWHWMGPHGHLTEAHLARQFDILPVHSQHLGHIRIIGFNVIYMILYVYHHKLSKPLSACDDIQMLWGSNTLGSSPPRSDPPRCRTHSNLLLDLAFPWPFQTSDATHLSCDCHRFSWHGQYWPMFQVPGIRAVPPRTKTCFKGTEVY